MLALLVAVAVSVLAEQTAKPTTTTPATPAQPAAASQPAAQLPRTEARERNLRAYVEILRSDLRTQKVAVITELISSATLMTQRSGRFTARTSSN